MFILYFNVVGQERNSAYEGEVVTLGFNLRVMSAVKAESQALKPQSPFFSFQIQWAGIRCQGNGP